MSETLPSVKRAFVLVSNHFAGFAPASVNQFRKMASLGEIDWEKIMAQNFGAGTLDA
ncbi:MAG: hypothetical protein ACRDF4_04950 [Rhabdochlamydiaceae bacterium]